MDLSSLLPLYDKVAAGGVTGLASTVVAVVLGLLHITLAPWLVALIVTALIFGASYLKSETKIGKELAPLAPLAERVLNDLESEGPVLKKTKP